VLLLLVARSEADGADAAVAAADLGADRAPVAEPGPSERPLRPLR
jgi:hypothetical protein